MKTYLLRNPNPVKPRESAHGVRVQPVTPPRVALTPPGPALSIGLDVQNDSIAVSLAASDSIEVRRYGVTGRQHDDVLKVLKKLAAAHPCLALQCC
jgi:hypothetical protein